MIKIVLLSILVAFTLAAPQTDQGLLSSMLKEIGLDQTANSLFAYITDVWNTDYQISTPDDYDKERQQLIQNSKQQYFTVDVPKLTDKEKQVEDIMFKLRDEIVQGDVSPLLLPFYDSKQVIYNSHIYEFITKMPKGAHLHLHLSAAYPLELVMELTYEDNVYFSMENTRLVVDSDHPLNDDYVKCNDLRKDWDKEGTFDEYLKNKILLTAEEMKSQASSEIWKIFGRKFSIFSGIFKHPPYFQKGLLEICKQAINEGIYTLEFRKSLLGTFEDVDKQLKPFQEGLKEVKKIMPEFELTIIVTSGKPKDLHYVKETLENYNYARQHYNFVTGFDLISEEDKSPPIYYFKDVILEYKNKLKLEGENEFNMYFHAGESLNRSNLNLYDALLLGTKRIGHGVNIFHHPYLIDMIKERNVAFEVCPISNFILGYTLDMRLHPIRNLMAQGVPVTISSDDPTMWDYSLLSLDFTYALIAWQLDLKDLKQLAINSIKYSSIKAQQKEVQLKKFHEDWSKFINSIHGAHILVSE